MKKLIVIVFILSACTKKTNTDNEDGYLTYSTATETVKYQGSYSSVSSGNSGAYMAKISNSVLSTRYIITGQNGPNSIVRLEIVTDSLKVGMSYNIPNGNSSLGNTLIIRNGKTYTTYHPTRPTKINVSIASHSNGKVEGTFSGKLFLLDVNQSIPTDSIIVTGEFKKVESIY